MTTTGDNLSPLLQDLKLCTCKYRCNCKVTQKTNNPNTTGIRPNEPIAFENNDPMTDSNESPMSDDPEGYVSEISFLLTKCQIQSNNSSMPYIC